MIIYTCWHTGNLKSMEVATLQTVSMGNVSIIKSYFRMLNMIMNAGEVHFHN